MSRGNGGRITSTARSVGCPGRRSTGLFFGREAAHGRADFGAQPDRHGALAREVFEDEKEVDAFRDHIFRVLLTHMMADPGTIERARALILISRNLERVGDHATNIAEEVIYLVEGREVRHHRESKA
jgi:hypothetical protein